MGIGLDYDEMSFEGNHGSLEAWLWGTRRLYIEKDRNIGSWGEVSQYRK